MNPVERAVPAPQAEIVIQRRARRQIFRDGPPLAAGAQDVHQPIDNLAKVHRTLVAAALSWRDAGRDQRPFLMGQVAWIAQAAPIVAA